MLAHSPEKNKKKQAKTKLIINCNSNSSSTTQISLNPFSKQLIANQIADTSTKQITENIENMCVRMQACMYV